jgi:penicillin-binding protein 2
MWRKKKTTFLEMDELIVDFHNVPAHVRDNFEDSIEAPINQRAFFGVFVTVTLIGVMLLGRIGYLQIVFGEDFTNRSNNNYLRSVQIMPERGTIYDREGLLLASNEFPQVQFSDSKEILNGEKTTDWVRRYPEEGFLHVLGFLSNAKDGIADGVSGIEQFYNEILRGKSGQMIEEIDATGGVVDSGIGVERVHGGNIKTTLFRDLQIVLSENIKSTASERGFVGGAGVIMDVQTGEVLALASVPEFDPNILQDHPSAEVISGLIADENKPFFNRAISGSYPPGSIVKLAVAAAALNEEIIDPDTNIETNGSLIVPNPYDPDRPTVFPDWKNHGVVDMRKSIAVSSNVYFYTIGGGAGTQEGLGVDRINTYFSLFGFGDITGIDLEGEKTGLLPDPYDSERTRPWTLGDTYHLSIGQGDIVVTPLQMAVYASAVASNGTVHTPYLVSAFLDGDNNPINYIKIVPKRTRILSTDIFNVIKSGMRDAVLNGTAKGLSYLPVDIAAKTGTAEIGNTGEVHSWSIGFFPYDEPKIAFAIVMEKGSEENQVGGTFVASKTIQWIIENEILSRLEDDGSRLDD